jgi:hypothetical protein
MKTNYVNDASLNEGAATTGFEGEKVTIRAISEGGLL